ncbi:CoA transferase [Roseomonas frigidaquae]|uniref:CoA transferase n=1 Tax=Falsiroseomonas frigidaquae TaxID=487318 RepID=A0ABX1F2H6_9PROT|nr:CoA transferase [Falsiroseomonas frigidaquae]NKE46523.1 CoA transferase [Falsiroseomonas frigidaquae]
MDGSPGAKVPALQELLALRDAPEPAAGEVCITGADPFFRTPFRIGQAVSGALAATGVAANDIWQMRGHARQAISVHLPEAAATLRTVDYTRARGADGQYRHVPIPQAMSHMLQVTQPWRTRDGRWFLPHLNLPELSARVLGVLGCASTPEAVSAAVAARDAEELEDAIAAAQACGGVIRTREEWLAHPQGAWLAGRPVVELAQVGPAPPEDFHPGDRPLSGVRVLDLTRILAGPVGSRGLAEHGADVLMVTTRELPQTPEHVRDTSHGKRSCFLDLKTAAGAARFAKLVREADVVVNGYRPGALARLGFGMEELARLRPGIIQVSVSCFGAGGPFADRAGWEQVAQAVTGICATQGAAIGAGQPKLVFAPVCDYTTGYLATYGALLALARRARQGGSWQVHVSLCQSAMLVQRQGQLQDFAAAPEALSEAELAPLQVREEGVHGDLLTLGPVLRMSGTQPRWDRPTPLLGGDAPSWLPRQA